MGTASCVDIILAILLPPLGVFFKYECKVLSLLSLNYLSMYTYRSMSTENI